MVKYIMRHFAGDLQFHFLMEYVAPLYKMYHTGTKKVWFGRVSSENLKRYIHDTGVSTLSKHFTVTRAVKIHMILTNLYVFYLDFNHRTCPELFHY